MSHFTSLYVKKSVITVELFLFIIHGTTDELANSNCNNLSSQRQFSVTAPVFWLHNLLESILFRYLLRMLVLLSLHKPFQTFTWCHEGSQMFHLFPYITYSWQSSVVWSHNHNSAFVTFRPNYFDFLRNHYSYMLPLASSTLFTHLGLFWSHYNNLMGSIKCRQHRISTHSGRCLWQNFQSLAYWP